MKNEHVSNQRPRRDYTYVESDFPDEVEPEYRECKTCGHDFLLEHDQDEQCSECFETDAAWESQQRRDWA